MSGYFQDHADVTFYTTQIDGGINVCEAGYENCLPTKPYEFIPIDYYAIHYCVKGEGIFQILDHAEHIYPGDIFMIPPHTRNKYYPLPDNPWSYCWVGVRGTAVTRLLEACGLTSETFFLHYQVEEELTRCFERVYLASLAKEEIRTIAALYQLLDRIKSIHDDRQMAPLTSPELLNQELVQYIQTNYAAELSVTQMAEDHHIDRTYLFKLFKKYQHTSPSQYLLEYRLEKASMLLMKSSLSITEISSAVGFQSAPYFSRQFLRYRGTTPSAFRKRYLRTAGQPFFIPGP